MARNTHPPLESRRQVLRSTVRSGWPARLLTRNERMLRKIDCIMIRVEDVQVSAAYYAKVFGLRPEWSGEGAVGLVFPENDAEIVLQRSVWYEALHPRYHERSSSFQSCRTTEHRV